MLVICLHKCVCLRSMGIFHKTSLSNKLQWFLFKCDFFYFTMFSHVNLNT
ncbi:F24O1.2 [Arabidopsis thaliana]|uniref:F24O1.2 n=1 Tax=Arabidopsis thaliana TaxID=3702 RepID=Q9MAV6_ARATH|nr:F24O1.2 [Arabidopsis thaliana]